MTREGGEAACQHRSVGGWAGGWAWGRGARPAGPPRWSAAGGALLLTPQLAQQQVGQVKVSHIKGGRLLKPSAVLAGREGGRGWWGSCGVHRGACTSGQRCNPHAAGGPPPTHPTRPPSAPLVRAEEGACVEHQRVEGGAQRAVGARQAAHRAVRRRGGRGGQAGEERGTRAGLGNRQAHRQEPPPPPPPPPSLPHASEVRSH